MLKERLKKLTVKKKDIEKNPLLDWAKHIIFPVCQQMIIPEEPKWNTPENIILMKN